MKLPLAQLTRPAGPELSGGRTPATTMAIGARSFISG